MAIMIGIGWVAYFPAAIAISFGWVIYITIQSLTDRLFFVTTFINMEDESFA